MAVLPNRFGSKGGDGQTGVLRIAAIPTIAPYDLPGLLREFREAFPRASVQIYEDVTEPSIKRCEDGDVDLALATTRAAQRPASRPNLIQAHPDRSCFPRVIAVPGRERRNLLG